MSQGQNRQNGLLRQVPKPFRLGIWCDYSHTLLPHKGLGAFVDRLTSSLLALDEPLEIIWKIRPSDKKHLHSFRSWGRPGLDYYPRRRLRLSWQQRLMAVIDAWIKFRNAIERQSEGLKNRLQSGISAVRQVGARLVRSLSGQTGPLKWITLLLLILLAPVAFLLAWCAWSIRRLVAAALASLCFPARMIDPVIRALPRLLQLNAACEPQLMSEASCDVWLIPDPRLERPLNFPSLLVLPKQIAGPGKSDGLAAARAEEATLCVCFSASIRDHSLAASFHVPAAKIRMISASSSFAHSLLEVCKEAAEMGAWSPEARRRHFEHPWPNATSSSSADPEPLSILMFLQLSYLTGVWPTTKSLIRHLVQINRERGRLSLILGVERDQPDTQELEALAPDLRLERFHLDYLSRRELTTLFGEKPAFLGGRSEESFCFLNGCHESALRADAWFALVDRFFLPLLPVRPYGVMVYDMIQKYVPESFSPSFFETWAKGIRPTIENAHSVLVTSEPTKGDVLEAYRLDPARVHLIPVACETHQRFRDVQSEPVPLAREPFILNVTNAVAHKGGSVLLKALARLKVRLGSATPLLVMTGWMTNAFSPDYHGEIDDPAFQKVRDLVKKLELQEGRDVAFLGFVNNGELLDLYQRCRLVVNAAKYDNGSFSLIEGRYFGRPVVSTRYPAAESLCQRFRIPAHFVPIDDDEALANALDKVFQEPLAQGADLDVVRNQLSDPELGLRRYAERVYDCLVELAEQGRRRRGLIQNDKTAA
jgi:glycosyltransferase involved in cell wall biosynthesis